ncbi:MAG: PAS domain-containing sensor histidine kinase, partial [Nitrospinota bacterium]|nr:PAS domain-containing sensor histidine kinase [Nitrospinota bacterium]
MNPAISYGNYPENEILSAIEDAPAYVYKVIFEKGAAPVQFHSPSCEAILGYSPEEYEQDPFLWLNMVHEEDQEMVREFMESVQSHETDLCSEITHRIRRKDGAVIWVLNRLTLRVARNEGVYWICGVVLDVTRQKMLAQELHNSERSYRALFDNADDMVFTCDSSGVITSMNGAGLKLLGYDGEMVNGKHILGLTHKLHLEKTRSLLKSRICVGKKGEPIEIIAKNRLGGQVPLEVSVRQLPDGQFLAIGRDITNHKANEAFSSHLISTLKERVKELDCLYKISAMTSEHGASLEEIFQGVVANLSTACNYPEIAAARVLYGDYEVASENYQPTEWTLSEGIYISGEPVGKVEIVLLEQRPPQDIGPFLREELNLLLCVSQRLGVVISRNRFERDLENSNRNLEEANKDLEEANKNLARAQEEVKLALNQAEGKRAAATEATILKDKFVSLVAHDLKSPLASVQSLLKLVHDDADHPPYFKHKTFTGRCISVTENMLKMIDDLLNLTRLKTGSLQVKRHFVDAHLISGDVVDSYQIMADGKKVALVNDVPAGTRIYADTSLFSEALQNIVSNGLKFSKKGGVVRVFALEGGGGIAVSDQGVGINPALLESLFSAEVRTSTKGTAGEVGTGLGLPFCMDIMKAHDGDILVESEEGKGSVFYLQLPVRKPEVLLVDDDTDFQAIVEYLMVGIDVDIVKANNGMEAFEQLE